MCDVTSLFGGPSAGEKSAYGTESNLTQTLLGYMGQQYGQQQDVLKKLTAQIGRIQTGQTLPGMSGAEYNAQKAQILAGGAGAAINATQAAQDRSAGQVFGGTSAAGNTRASAINKQVAGAINNREAEATAGALNALTGQDYAIGRQNATTSASLLGSQVGMYNPAAYASGASSANQASFKMADTMQQQQTAADSAMLALAGKGVSMGASAIAGGLGNLDKQGTSSFGEQIENFASGAFSGAMG